MCEENVPVIPEYNTSIPRYGNGSIVRDTMFSNRYEHSESLNREDHNMKSCSNPQIDYEMIKNPEYHIGNQTDIKCGYIQGKPINQKWWGSWQLSRKIF